MTEQILQPPVVILGARWKMALAAVVALGVFLLDHPDPEVRLIAWIAILLRMAASPRTGP